MSNDFHHFYNEEARIMKEGAVEGWRGEEGGTKRRSGQGPMVLDFQFTPFCVDKRVLRGEI